MNSTGSTKARRYPLSYIYSGNYYWGDGKTYSQNTAGVWWSSLANSNIEAYDLITTSSVLYSQPNNNKAHSLTLRFLSTPPAQPKPAGIRFRIYYQGVMFGQMVSYTIKMSIYIFGQILVLTMMKRDYFIYPELILREITHKTQYIKTGVVLSVAPFKSFSFKDFRSTGSTKARRYPLSYIFSGYYVWGNGGLGTQGTFGDWWSTSAYSSTYAYFLYMSSSELNPQGSNNKALGLTLRCVTQNFFFQKF